MSSSCCRSHSNAICAQPLLCRLRHPLTALGLVLLALSGCRSTSGVWNDSRPLSHSVQTGDFVIRSDFLIADDAPMIQELKQLQADITETLHLPPPRDPVVVYLFSGEAAYRKYMRKTWPTLPARRAYFIGTSRELAVYSFHGPRVEEDLRHELTHGLLHATLKTVPLWLDEGLAEYFEVRGHESGGLHPEHLKTLQRLTHRNWSPSVSRLESIVDFKKFGRQDYAEAWGWVHFLLQDDAEHQQILLDYVADLRDNETAGSFQARLEPALRAPTHQLASYITALGKPPGRTFLRL